MHQPDSERAATAHTVGKHIDDFSGVEVAGSLHQAQFPTRCVLMTASSLADKALQMVSWGFDYVRSGSPADQAIIGRNLMGEMVSGRSGPPGRLHGASPATETGISASSTGTAEVI